MGVDVRKARTKYREGPPAVKAAVAFTISNFVLRGISFITTPVFTRLMSQSQYGVVSLYNSWQTILEVFALLGLTSAGVFQVGLNDYRDLREQYMSSILLLCNLSTILVFAVLFGGKMLLGEKFLLPTSLLLLMFLTFLFSPAQIFWVTRQRYEYRYKLATAITIGSAVFTQFISVLCVMKAPENNAAEAKLWSSGLAAMVFYIPIYFYIFVSGKTGCRGKIWKQTLIFAVPLLPHYLAQHVMAGADRIMIADLFSQEAAAVYAVVSAVSLIASFVWNAINASLTPFVFERMNQKEYQRIDRVVTELIAVYAVMCCGVALVAPEVLAILAPPDYQYGVYAVPPIAGVAFLSAFYNIYATIEFYHKKPTSIAAATIVSCVVNIVLNALFIPHFGFLAAAYTTLISNMVLIFMHYAGYRRCQKVRVYHDRKFVVIGVFTMIACEICNFLYVNAVVRYSVAAVLAMVCAWKRKWILEKFKTIRKTDG